MNIPDSPEPSIWVDISRHTPLRAWQDGWQDGYLAGYRAACEAVKTVQLELFRVDL